MSQVAVHELARQRPGATVYGSSSPTRGDRLQATQRDVYPIGSVSQLVTQLVERLLGLEQGEQRLHLSERGVQPRVANALLIGVEERYMRLMLPVSEQRIELFAVLA